MHDIYIDGDDTRIGCERCGIHFHMKTDWYGRNVARMYKYTYICRDCRPYLGQEELG